MRFLVIHLFHLNGEIPIQKLRNACGYELQTNVSNYVAAKSFRMIYPKTIQNIKILG